MATVPEIISDQTAAAYSFIAQAEGFINRVANLANTEFTVTIPAGLGFGNTDYTADALDKINGEKPVRPTFDDIEVLSPTSPVIAFEEIDQSILDQVKAKIAGDLTDGGYGIEPNDEAGLLQRERDREDMLGMQGSEEITRQFAESGFPYPPGAMFNAQANALKDRQNKLSSLSREITLRRSEQYVQNRRFAIEQASTIEGVLIALHRVLTEQVLAATTLFNSQIQKYRADVDAEVEIIRANLGIYTGDVNAFVASIQAISEAYKLQNTERQLNNNWNVEVIKTKLAEADIRLKGQTSSAAVRNSSAQFGAQYYMGAITAALGSINALASQSATD